MVTAGATQGLHLVSTVMYDKSTPVFMEDPSYFIALKMIKEDFGMNIIPGEWLWNARAEPRGGNIYRFR